jgi:hypothetical protein
LDSKLIFNIPLQEKLLEASNGSKKTSVITDGSALQLLCSL